MTHPARRKRAKPKILWSDKARADLARIGDCIAADNPRAAEQWVGKLIALVEKSARVPMAGRVVPESRRTDLRERILRHYRVVYRLQQNGIEVVTIFEGHRRFPPHAVPDEE
jgi:plasmid stabilization system protein ParE